MSQRSFLPVWSPGLAPSWKGGSGDSRSSWPAPEKANTFETSCLGVQGAHPALDRPGAAPLSAVLCRGRKSPSAERETGGKIGIMDAHAGGYLPKAGNERTLALALACLRGGDGADFRKERIWLSQRILFEEYF